MFQFSIVARPSSYSLTGRSKSIAGVLPIGILATRNALKYPISVVGIAIVSPSQVDPIHWRRKNGSGGIHSYSIL